MFTLGILSIELWHTQMPVWAFVIALLIGNLHSQALLGANTLLREAFTYVIPCGMIQAITNQQVGLKYADLCASI